MSMDDKRVRDAEIRMRAAETRMRAADGDVSAYIAFCFGIVALLVIIGFATAFMPK